jgi:pilus assembly protein CpaE
VVPEVLVVDPLDRELERMLGEAGMRTARANGGELAALAHPAAHEPDVLVVDLRGGRGVPAALSAVKKHHPNVGVLVVASAPDPAVLLEAMRAGAGEFLAEPLAPPQLDAAVKRLVAERTVPVAGEVFAFLGAKGGVGTTTMAVNVATVLAKATHGKTLLIDLHLAHGDTAVFLGAEPRFSIVDAIENTHRFDEAFFRGLVTPTKGGPDLLASSDRALVHTTGMQQFRTVVDFAARLYQYVVLDVPRSDAAALDALDVASSIIVVANQELSTVRSASRISTALRQRYGKDKVTVVVSRFDKQSDISHSDVERVVGGKVKHVVPSDYRLALQALNRGRPLAVENHNKLTAAFKDLALDLAGISEQPSKRSEQGSRLFGRLTGKG